MRSAQTPFICYNDLSDGRADHGAFLSTHLLGKIVFNRV